MLQGREYPPNMAALQGWTTELRRRIEIRRENGLDDKYTYTFLNDWVNRFSARFRYIDHVEFSKQVFETIEWLKQHINQQETPYTAVVLTFGGLIYKSDAWVTMFVWPHISNVVTHVLDRGNIMPFARSIGKGRVLVVHFDDAAYSGTQYADELLETYEEQGRRLDITHACALVFATDRAVYEITERAANFIPYVNLIFRQTAENTINPLYGRDDAPPLQITSHMWLAFLSVDFTDSENRTATYFFHKIADDLSTYIKIFAFVPLPPIDSNDSRDIESYGVSLVTGCNYSNLLEEYSMRKLLRSAIIAKFPCPLPPYKEYLPWIGNRGDIFAYLATVKINCQVCSRVASYVCGQCRQSPYCGSICQKMDRSHACIKK